ncbi:MAG: response regulator transcription factor [Verrucomicrobiaceae bacterium]|nr:MAG: response regulator transcription factor [Verrucomicrobiaceae bacterium]
MRCRKTSRTSSSSSARARSTPRRGSRTASASTMCPPDSISSPTPPWEPSRRSSMCAEIKRKKQYTMVATLPVAVIEEDAEQRIALVEMLSSVSEVRLLGAFENVERALSTLVHERPKVVMMGARISGTSTPQCLSRLKKALPNLLIVIVAGHRNSCGAFEALASGASGYLLRRDLPGRLYGALVDVLSGGYPISSLAAREAFTPVMKAREEGPKKEFSLTDRELDCLRLVSEGKLMKEVADELDIGFETVRTHVRRLYRKLDVHTRAQAIVKYLAYEDSRRHETFS